MPKYLFAVLILLALSFNAKARDTLFHGVWGSDTNAFKAIWGNFLINEKEIFWGRLDGKSWKSDLQNYACSAEYEIDSRGKGESFPDDPHSNSRDGGDIFIYVRYKLINKRCNYEGMENSHISRELGYLLFSTGYAGFYGGNVIVIEYDLSGQKRGHGFANKIKHISK